MTTDTVFAIFSTTKSDHRHGGSTMRRGRQTRPGRPGKDLRPRHWQARSAGWVRRRRQAKLRAPKRDITTRMLMLHTAGSGYDFFNASYLRLAQERVGGKRPVPEIEWCQTTLRSLPSLEREIALLLEVLALAGDQLDEVSEGLVNRIVADHELGEGLALQLLSGIPRQHPGMAVRGPDDALACLSQDDDLPGLEHAGDEVRVRYPALRRASATPRAGPRAARIA